MYKEELQQLRESIENDEKKKQEQEQEQIEKRRQKIEEDVENFLKVLVSCFKESRTLNFKIEYKIRNESSFGIFGQPFLPNHILVEWMESEPKISYAKLLNKWFFIDDSLLREVLEKKLNDCSIIYNDRAIGRKKRCSSFSVQ